MLIVNAQSLAAERLPVYARDLGLDGERFDRCLKEGGYHAAEEGDADDARALRSLFDSRAFARSGR